MEKKIVVVFSGGQDSTTCLMEAINQVGVENVHPISFEYGQKHIIEMECADAICADLGLVRKVVNLDSFGQLVTSALTQDGDVATDHAYKEDLPASFVPNRNATFLTLAHAYAQEVGASELHTGVCQTDYSGYPDCRMEFVQAIQDALNIGYQTTIGISTPLMYLTKAETFQMAQDGGYLDTIVQKTHTCYNGDHETLHDWGYGCGECPACTLRKEGWLEFIGEATQTKTVQTGE